MRFSGGLVAAIALCSIVQPVSAHHYMAEWDNKSPLELTGTVKEWQWTNPHSWLILLADDGKGGTKEWALESSSPAHWKRVGLTRQLIKVGDKVSVVVAPARDGRFAGGLSLIVTINGAAGPGHVEGQARIDPSASAKASPAAAAPAAPAKK